MQTSPIKDFEKVTDKESTDKDVLVFEVNSYCNNLTIPGPREYEWDPIKQRLEPVETTDFLVKKGVSRVQVERKDLPVLESLVETHSDDLLRFAKEFKEDLEQLEKTNVPDRVIRDHLFRNNEVARFTALHRRAPKPLVSAKFIENLGPKTDKFEQDRAQRNQVMKALTEFSDAREKEDKIRSLENELSELKALMKEFVSAQKPTRSTNRSTKK